jgi:hypothetical protein
VGAMGAVESDDIHAGAHHRRDGLR